MEESSADRRRTPQRMEDEIMADQYMAKLPQMNKH
eukprot:CAMPEP_0170545060 /NCGR_PEP_ID=MMETSP0211-20121228/3586_1 /TAXON_ID=311385 /ORGANISM="Pseudokeronopsis sp., Strain OXSARD2" /LENGTH=34 /DNA_ID= /DNA_START= /DNA_END= /DNA_ORIENTATION=